MSKFQYDDAGFLKGELIDLRQQDAQNHLATIATLRRIDRNVAALKDLAASKISRRPAVEPQSRPEGAASRGGLRRYSGPIAEPQGRPASEGARRALASGKLRGVSLDDSVRARDSNGRFVGGGNAGPKGDRPGAELSGVNVRLDKLAGAVAAGLERSGQIDPGMEAVREIKGVVEPIGRSAFAMLGRSPDQKRERWYQRIWRTLGGMSRQDALHARLQDRRLREMAAMGMGGGGGGSGGGLFGGGGMFGGLLSGLGPAILSVLPKVLMSVFGPAGAAMAGWFAGTKLYEWLDKQGIVTKFLDVVDEMKASFSSTWDSVANYAQKKWDDIGNYVKKQWQRVTDTAEDVANSATSAWDDFNRGFDEHNGGPVLDRSGRNVKDPRIERVTGKASETPDKLPEATSVAQRLGRAAGAVTGLVRSIVSSGKDYNEVELEDGTRVRQEGARNWRNNNPGNLEFNGFTKKAGAIGSDGRFAVFPDYETGRKAKERLIFEGKNYSGLTLDKAIARYAPPHENNTGAYQRTVLAAVGGQNKRMSDYTPAEREAIMSAMERVEGFKVGKTTVLSGPAASPMMRGPAVTAGVLPMPAQVQIPPPVAIPPMPDTGMPALADLGKAKPTSVIVREPIGQDVGDRAIAHIVTGGLGGA